MADFNPGDVVQLKTGGPYMTVDGEMGGNLLCAWFVGNKPNKEYFAPEALKMAPEGWDDEDTPSISMG